MFTQALNSNHNLLEDVICRGNPDELACKLCEDEGETVDVKVVDEVEALVNQQDGILQKLDNKVACESNENWHLVSVSNSPIN